ncbi:CsbD family protein [Methylobacterium sp. Leaf118]|uniref:CsbD family protein n=1 Tax=Methylobacterium sp. Leaf118 TaxID=2876562 RepID=UPI001E4C18EC|nr:CsbD family protein [Methylobacterium sp. Leaf118]
MVDTDRIVGAAKDVGGRVQGAVGDAAGSDRDSLEGRYREAEGRAQRLYGQAKDAVRDVADDVGDYANDAYDRVSRHGGTYLRDGRERVETQVGESPFLALLVAGAVGYGLALLLHSRR